MSTMTGSNGVISQACTYARLKMHVFPVRWNPGGDGHKAPMPGYAWRATASCTINEVVEDFDRAIQLWGEDSVMIAWALGEDGFMAVDLDTSDEPGWVTEIETAAAINRTNKGRHLVTLFPTEFVPGNGANGFPTKGWGEVRGQGGYIIIAGPDRPGFDGQHLQRCRPFPRPDYLQPYGGPVDAISREELVEFANRYNSASNMNMLHGIEDACRDFERDWEANGKPSRHMFAVWAMTCGAEDAIRGLYPFKAASDVVHAMFGRMKPHADKREWIDILAWAAAKAQANLRPAADEPSEDESDGSVLGDNITSSFRPVDLGPWLAGAVTTIEPDLLMMEDGKGLMYLDRLNEVHGDSGAGKSWLIPLAISQLSRRGLAVAVLDVEDNPMPLIQRCRQIGLTDGEIIASVLFMHPDDPWTRDAVEQIIAAVADWPVRIGHLFVDSLGEAFALDGVSENQDDEVGPWISRVSRRLINATGAGVTHIDHITKAAENPWHPSGSKRKRAAISGSSWLLSEDVPFSKELGGRAQLLCAKDRHGNYKRKDHVANLIMAPTLDNCALYLERARSSSLTDESKRDWTMSRMQAVVNVCEKYPDRWLSTNAVEAEVGGRKGTTKGALELAEMRGFVERRDAKRGVEWRYRAPFSEMTNAEWKARLRLVDNDDPE